MSEARKALTRALVTSLEYATVAVVAVLVDLAADSWIKRRAARADEGQAVLDDQADEKGTNT